MKRTAMTRIRIRECIRINDCSVLFAVEPRHEYIILGDVGMCGGGGGHEDTVISSALRTDMNKETIQGSVWFGLEYLSLRQRCFRYITKCDVGYLS